MTGLPVGIGQGTVTGKLIATQQTPSSDADIDAVPLAGSVTFTPAIAKAIHLASSSVIVPRAVTVTLDGTGAFTTKLIATDDPDLNPTGWTYLVSFQLTGASLDPFSISVPDASTTDLSAVVPVAPSAGSGSLVAANITDFTEASQDVIGAMIAAAGGTYNDPAGTITLPASGGAALATTSAEDVLMLGAPDGSSSTQNTSIVVFGLVIVPVALTFASIACEVTAAAASSTVTLAICTRSGATLTKVFESSALDSTTTGVKSQTGLSQALPAGVYWVGSMSAGGGPQVRRMGQPPSMWALPLTGTLTAADTALPFVYVSPEAPPLAASMTITDATSALQPALVRLGGVTY